jgi:anti-anti-sigma factor
MLENAYAGSCESVPSPFSVSGHARPNEIVLVFKGEADVAAAPLVEHALTRASAYPHMRVLIDLADVEFIDTHCLAIIFGVHDELRDRGAELVLRSPRPPVRRLLDILGRQDLVDNR